MNRIKKVQNNFQNQYQIYKLFKLTIKYSLKDYKQIENLIIED